MSRENKVPEKTGKKLSLPAAPAPASPADMAHYDAIAANYRAAPATSADYAMGYAEGFNDACKPAPVVPEGDMVMVPTHLSVDQLEAFVGHGLCCGSEPIEEAVIDAGHKWTRLLGRIAAAPAPAVREPLTTKQLEVVIYDHTKLNPNQADDRELIDYIVNAIRAIEQAHGIGGGGK